VQSIYASLKNDVVVVSNTPPIQGIIRSMANSGIDPLDGLSQADWRKRLETTFTSFLQTRSYYTQVRYIGLSDNGRTLVRVNKGEDNVIRRVAPALLQQKGDEFYFLQGTKLNRDDIYYSSVTYNREFGKIDPALIPTLRVVLPIFGSDSRRFGMLVINANYEKMLRAALDDIGIVDDVYVSDKIGNYINRTNDGKTSLLEVNQHYTSPAPIFISDFAKKIKTNGEFVEGNSIGYAHRQEIDPLQTGQYFGVFLLMPKSELMAGANAVMRQSLITGLILVVVSSLMAGLIGDRFTKPITQMTRSIKAFGEGGGRALKLPTDLRDEVGEMARAFDNLVSQLNLSNAHRMKLSLQLQAFIANSVDGVVIINDQGVIEEVNPAGLGLFGYERNELIGRNVGMLMPDAIREAHDGYLRAYRKTGKKTYIGSIRDEEARRKDGSIFPIALSISEVRLADRRIFTGVVRDMTAIRATQLEIQRNTAELERSNQELDQFAYIASHDLKAPLRVIDNASRWLEEDLGEKLTDEDRENMTLLRNRVKRMEKLLDDLLEYSRVGRTNDAHSDQIIDGHTLIQDVLLLLGPSPTLKVEIGDGFKTIRVNPVPLQQVLYNLIGNAIKHHDRDGGVIEVGVTETESRLQFTVRDDGPGIPEEFHEKIFGMFHTLKPRDQVEGSGMGLALVKKIVERFGGKVTVISGEGRGTEFSFTWPKEQTEGDLASRVA
jgi:PAS domain S-box-containing protein